MVMSLLGATSVRFREVGVKADLIFLMAREGVRHSTGSEMIRLLIVVVSFLGSPFVAAEDRVTIERGAGTLRVMLGGEPFTEYLLEGNQKPILYPVYGPGGVAMVRNFPMKKAKGEAFDHPHHRSLWFAHGDVNGVSFWHEGEGCGKTVHDTLLEVSSGEEGVIKTFNKWVGPDGRVHCTDIRTVTFHLLNDGSRAIDYEITLYASEGKVTFGDTKEGTMAIRTHPNLRLANDPEHGVTTANGKALNSSGFRNHDLWGKRAAWVDYWGAIDGTTLGIAIFDHPKNPRHPTWWHARDYGLIAANAFGVHDFSKKPKGTGNMVLAAGDSVAFRYRFIFHEGDAETAKIAEAYARFAQKK